MSNEKLIEKWSDSGFFSNDLSDEKKLVLIEWLEKKIPPILRKRRKLEKAEFDRRLLGAIASYQRFKNEQ